MKCWCNTDVENSFHPEYFICPVCKTFISKKEVRESYYDFDYYWHEKQVSDYGFPTIETRAKTDFFDRIPFWFDQLKGIAFNSVLEIGAGHGGFLYYCKKNGIDRCVGIEISEGTCEFAKKTFGLEMLKGNFPYMNIEEKFDLVCGFDVFEHISEPVKALYKMKSLGKYIMLQIPCYRGENTGFCHFNSGEHMYIYNEQSILKLFDYVNMKVIHSVKGAFHQDITIIGVEK
jgi:SAM-dependent methyltransferase